MNDAMLTVEELEQFPCDVVEAAEGGQRGGCGQQKTYSIPGEIHQRTYTRTYKIRCEQGGHWTEVTENWKQTVQNIHRYRSTCIGDQNPPGSSHHKHKVEVERLGVDEKTIQKWLQSSEKDCGH